MSKPSALLPCLLALLAVPLSAQNGKFSTGPTTGPINPPGSASASPPGGNDVRANTVTASVQNETSLAVNPTNDRNWVGTANDYSPGNVRSGWYTTMDGGQTWIGGTFPMTPGFSFSGDPAVTFDSQGIVNVACMMYSGPAGINRLVTFRSLDGGQTWLPAVTVGATGGYDKPQIEADLGPSSPHRDHLLVAWDDFGTIGGDTIVAAVSTDQGASWSAPQVISNANVNGISPDVAWGANGEAYVMWADRGIRDVVFDRSLDGGITWGPDIKIADYLQIPTPLPGNALRMFDIFAMHADQSDGPFRGRIYVAFHTLSSAGIQHAADVLVSTSSDQGVTWSPAVKVSSDVGQNNDQIFPGVVVDPQGGVNVAFYDQRLDPADLLLHTWVARSADGGVSWRDVQVSDAPWSDGNTEFPSFIGDYIDNESAPNGLLHPFWCDGRTGSQDVYTDSVNLQLATDLDTLSAATGGVISFAIETGPNQGGHIYLLAATGSGTLPGVNVGGVHVPLNLDPWTDLTLNLAGTIALPNSLGVLDAKGASAAQFNTLGPFAAVFVGTQLDWSVVTLGPGGFSHATPTTRVTLVP